MANEPTLRTAALHALECEVERGATPPGARLAQAIQEFVARGMPFYSCADPHYLEWVERAVDYWERLQRGRGPEGSGARSRERSAVSA